ncbi:MAG: 2-hydroxyacyl-CoA dehydratase family protein [Chloroflexi bacterium]|nr:2-hydroxyacyl-CoA dehydratase family protein [Chloroflexota bacterium]
MAKNPDKIGYFCSLVPEEIILAAGMKPVRIRGEAETASDADGYLYHNLCPYIKNVMSTALEGGARHLNGVVFARSCDGMRRMYDAWKSYIGTGFVYMLDAPKNTDDRAVSYFASRLKDFAQTLGVASGKEITPASLNKAIQATEKLRKSMQQVFSLQQSVLLPVDGSELFKLGLSVIGDDHATALKKIGEFYQQARTAGSERSNFHKPRLLISGNVMDRTDLFEIIEAAGAEIPAADLCTDLRYFTRNVDGAKDDPYTALARAYLGEPHCSRTASPVQRSREIEKLVEKYSIDGVLLTSLKFCDQHLYDVPYITKALADKNIPVLFLENDYTFTNKGQMKVRVEAFIEVLNERGN